MYTFGLWYFVMRADAVWFLCTTSNCTSTSRSVVVLLLVLLLLLHSSNNIVEWNCMTYLGQRPTPPQKRGLGRMPLCA